MRWRRPPRGARALAGRAPPGRRCSPPVPPRRPREARGLTRHYFVENNEEVSILRLAPPRTRLRPHSGGTNSRLSLELGLRGGEGASFRIGSEPWRSWVGHTGAAGRVLAYDSCQDREVRHEGPGPFYWLQVGVLHPGFVEALVARGLARAAAGEL